MAQFHVGQRVRIVDAEPEDRHLIGAEGVIVRAGIVHDWIVDLPAHEHAPTNLLASHWAFLSCALAPILPPAADSWADAKVKEVTRPVYTEPERVKERA